ncbi:DUF4062 domain-containing protein [Clostridium estertheticum]|uniref:DUF4062 domain-containing protein n=1 Tax=Clostridium estertheticum TaxID=238834 RepID=UPI001C7E01F3|nr:DUF4062 domain-containing protein [Clostridium estertheticum]MBX4258845.1 DUF4062 domain-containing protein [Clostridium estertheticum]WLC69149.1 DUF4062 domain-containing protein [Clostridium estertheticum]
MRKKLQVFVSSTYEDLIEERQEAVQAILNSGHLPAGMELFTAGDESQKDTIKKWIDESDVYLLILGGRYGTIDKSTNKSYTHWEYEYAGKMKKPRFAVVITEDAIEKKARTRGTNMMEKDNPALYKEFRDEVLSKVSKFYDDKRDIQIAILQKLAEYAGNEDLVGWIYGKDVPNINALSVESAKLRLQNDKLRVEVEKFKRDRNQSLQINEMDYEELKLLLSTNKITVPKYVTKGEELQTNLLKTFIKYKDYFATGVTNKVGTKEWETFFYYKVAPSLMVFDLTEKIKIAGARYEKIQTSKNGFKFLRLLQREELSALEEVVADKS